MRLIAGLAIKRAIQALHPGQVAVAYIGKTWAEYIDANALEEIIVSPTVGSNPHAIEDLVKRLGWSRVHFLDRLHAKIYIGENKAAVGSFNLSSNGLSAVGLEEAGFLVDDPGTMEELRQLYSSFKSQAMALYPNSASKQAKLDELFQAGMPELPSLGGGKVSPMLSDAYLSPDDLYICPVWGKMDYTNAVMSPKTISKALSFLEDDDIQPDRWILCWQARKDGYPESNAQPYWLYIDELVRKGSRHRVYTKVAIEKKNRRHPRPPFALDDSVKLALDHVLRSDKFPAFLAPREADWSITATLPALPDFLTDLQSAYRHLSVDVPPASLLMPNIMPRMRLRSVREELLSFLEQDYPEIGRGELGKNASWAIHLMFAEAGIPLDFRSYSDDMSILLAEREWLLKRIGSGLRYQRVIEMLDQLSRTNLFGNQASYWAGKTLRSLEG